MSSGGPLEGQNDRVLEYLVSLGYEVGSQKVTEGEATVMASA